MFAEHSVAIPQPSSQVEAALAEPGRSWGVDPNGDAHEPLALGVSIVGAPLYKRVRLTLGTPAVNIRPGRTILPVSMEPRSGAALFSRMEGSLAIVALKGNVTRLTLSVSYDSPVEQLDPGLDAALLHREGQATVKDLLENLASRLQKPGEPVVRLS